MAQSSPKMCQNALFRASNLKIFPLPYPTRPPTRQQRMEGAEAPYDITLTATPFQSPSTAKFGENPGPHNNSVFKSLNSEIITSPFV